MAHRTMGFHGRKCRSSNLIDREAAVDTYVFDSGFTQMPDSLDKNAWNSFSGAR